MWEIESVNRSILLCILAACACLDIKNRKIPVALLAAGSISGMISLVCNRQTGLYFYLAGAGVGVFFLFISKITKEAIGYGDSWLIGILGAVFGIYALLEILAAAWIFLSVTAMVCLVRKKWSRKTALPMVPFLMAGYVFWLSERYIK